MCTKLPRTPPARLQGGRSNICYWFQESMTIGMSVAMFALVPRQFPCCPLFGCNHLKLTVPRLAEDPILLRIPSIQWATRLQIQED